MANSFFRVLARVGGYRHVTDPVRDEPEAWMPADLQASLRANRSAPRDGVPEQPALPGLGRRLRPAPDAELPVDVRTVVHHRLGT